MCCCPEPAFNVFGHDDHRPCRSLNRKVHAQSLTDYRTIRSSRKDNEDTLCNRSPSALSKVGPSRSVHHGMSIDEILPTFPRRPPVCKRVGFFITRAVKSWLYLDCPCECFAMPTNSKPNNHSGHGKPCNRSNPIPTAPNSPHHRPSKYKRLLSTCGHSLQTGCQGPVRLPAPP